MKLLVGLILAFVGNSSVSLADEPFGAGGLTQIDLAVLHAIPFPWFTITEAAIGKVTQEQIDQERIDVANMKSWATTLPDGEIRHAYLGWATTFEKNIPEMEDEIRTHKREKAWEAERAAINNLAATLPTPPTHP